MIAESIMCSSGWIKSLAAALKTLVVLPDCGNNDAVRGWLENVVFDGGDGPSGEMSHILVPSFSHPNLEHNSYFNNPKS